MVRKATSPKRPTGLETLPLLYKRLSAVNSLIRSLERYQLAQDMVELNRPAKAA